MQRFTKFGAARASQQIAASLKKSVKVAEFSTVRELTFQPHEFTGPGDDDYFRSEEDIRQRKTMRANFIRIQSLPENAHEKFILKEMLVPKKESEKSFRERWGFYDWRVSSTMITYMALPLLSMELIPINMYYFLYVHFFWNSWFFYVFCAPRITPFADEGVYEILKTMQSTDDVEVEQMQSGISENEFLIKWEKEACDLQTVSDELTVAQVAVLNSIEGHAFRDTVASKLDALVTLEMAAQQSIRMRMVTSVKSEVKNLFLTNKTAKENAMNHAIAVLTAGPSATMGKDVVGEAYNAAVKAYQEDYAKRGAADDEIFVTLDKDMRALMVPPVFTATGGNVYETNPIGV